MGGVVERIHRAIVDRREARARAAARCRTELDWTDAGELEVRFATAIAIEIANLPANPNMQAESSRYTLPALLSLTMAAGALAQTKLPEPSRTVFKCVVAGRTAYTDQPCLGAQRVDVEPTRGLNKSTGKELLGADVTRERNREAFAEVIRPLTGMDAKQLDAQGKRTHLRPEIRSECAGLDTEIQTSELRERSVAPQERPQIQRSLLAQRQQHARLKC